MSIGYDMTTNLIWLIGASNFEKSLISFNLSIWNETSAIIDHGESVLPISTKSVGQSYVQTADIVYIIDYNNSNLLAFNVSTGDIHSVNTNPSIMNVLGCLAAIGEWIIYTLGNEVHILTISNQTWKSLDNPKTFETRYYHSCIIEPNAGYLYVIGGWSSVWSNAILNSIEKLYVNDILNINQYNFTTLTDTLSHPKCRTRSILYKTDIYVIGGAHIFLSYDDIDVIDTTRDFVALWGKLHIPIKDTSPILIGSKVYIFGGRSLTYTVNHWQYFDVFSISIYV